MKAFLYLPHAPRSSVHIGKVFIRNATYGRHLWKNRVFDLNSSKERDEFNKLVTDMCVRDSIYGHPPVPFILPPEPVAAPVAATPAPEPPKAEAAPEPAPAKKAPAKKAAAAAATPPAAA